jgi:hypothetical protein
MGLSIPEWLQESSRTDPRSFGGLEAGPFIFNDGDWYLFSALQICDSPYDGDAFPLLQSIRTVRLLGVVRSKSLDRARQAAHARFYGVNDIYVTCAFKPQVSRWRLKNLTKTLYRAPYKLNRAMCRRCRDVIESFYRHDFKTCRCGSIGVDGGYEYPRRLGDPKNIEEMP